MSVTGLVPVAPTPGVTLAADATTLRPLVAGASWGYAGTDTVDGNTSSYSNTVTQAADGSAWAESSSNGLNSGTDTSTVRSAGGIITSTSLVSLTGGPPQQLTFTELRSPVRQNDQTTVLDQHFTDVGSDLDGDGKNESGDIGIYRVVVGMEDVAMPNGTPQHAVRVDMIAMVRVTLSSNGATTPATQAALQSTWYAPGIGVVKQRLTMPASDGTQEVVEEVLTYFDGVTKGFGSNPATEARVAADSPVAAGQVLQSASEVVAFPDHAVVIGQSLTAATSYTAIGSIDNRGKVTQVNLYTDAPTHGYLAVGHQLVAVTTSTVGQCQVQLMPFDAQGARAGGPSSSVITFPPGPGESLCVDTSQMKFASDGSRLWLAVVRHSLGSTGWLTELVLQPFDANGSPLAGETTVYSANTYLSDQIVLTPGLLLKSMAGAGGKVYISYATDNSGQLHLASVGDAGVLAQSSIAVATASPTGVTLLATPSAAALLWQGPQDTDISAPPLGVMLDPNLSPVLSSGGSLGTQTLAQAMRTCVNCLFYQAGAGDTVLLERRDAVAGGPATSTLALYKTDAAALASQTVVPVKTDLSDFGNAEQYTLVPFPDRVLLVSQEQGPVSTKLIWLP